MAPPARKFRIYEGEGPARLPFFLSPSQSRQRTAKGVRLVELRNASVIARVYGPGVRGLLSGDVTMFMRTQRLFLRPTWAEDWADILSAVSEPTVARNLTLPWPCGEAEARGFAKQAQNPVFPHFLITRPLGGDGVETVGCVGFAQGPLGQTEFDCWVARPHWGQGIASEAARGVLQIARMLGHRRLIAKVFTDNPASGRVLRKLGFRPTGRRVLALSAARGGVVPAAELALDLAADGDGMMQYAA